MAKIKGEPDKRVSKKKTVVKKEKHVKKGSTKAEKVEKKGVRSKSKRENEEAEEAEADIVGDARKYFKEGQKFITPPNGDGTRAFYESLREENAYSLIAIKYCIEFGVLGGRKHRETYNLYKVLQEAGAFKGIMGGIKEKFQKDKIEKLLSQAAKKKK